MSSLLRRSLLVSALLVSLTGGVFAQWTNVAPNLLSGADRWGAIQFHAGVVWGGTNTLWFSRDSGKTWTQDKAFPNTFISDIAFYDTLHGVVGTESAGIFATTDGGQTWLQTKYTNIVKVGFGDSASEMYALCGDGPFYHTTSGPLGWKPLSGINFTQNVNAFGVANDGSIYVNGSLSGTTGVVAASHSRGQFWNNGAGTFNGDSWTMAVDSCNTGQLYVASENQFDPTGTSSNFFVSSDAGQSWQITDSHTTPYLSGSISTTTDGVLTGTRDGSGVHRSMDRGMTWKAIGGPVLGPDTRNLTAINDDIVLAIDTSGSIWLTINGGGDSVSMQPGGSLTPTITQVFTNDTVHCNPIQVTIPFVSTGCPVPYLLSASLAGADSASYAINSVENDSISVTLLTGTPGPHSAQLIAKLDNGYDTIQLGGIVAQYVGTFSISTPSLFANDTIACDSLTLPVTFGTTGCHPPTLSHAWITGKDSSSFRIVDSTSDSLAIRWSPTDSGKQNATLQFQTTDGKVQSVTLGGFSQSPPITYSVPPQTLFDTDTLYIGCQTDTATSFSFKVAACIFPHIQSEQIVGANASDYRITLPVGIPSAKIDSVDSVHISFQPSAAGIRNATYQLVLDNGKTISIPLAGVGYVTRALSLSGDGSTRTVDTIGATDSIPITIGNLARPETVELALHYTVPDLDYKGSIDRAGNPIDEPGTQTPGYSKLRIVNAQPGEVNGYAVFHVFSDTDYEPIVTFDLLQVPSEATACSYSLPTSISDTIAPLKGCAVQTLSQFIHFGQFPLFSIQPNPSHDGAVEVRSSLDAGSATLEVFDMLGTVRETFSATLSANALLPLSLPLETGIYYIRIATAAEVVNLPLAIER